MHIKTRGCTAHDACAAIYNPCTCNALHCLLQPNTEGEAGAEPVPSNVKSPKAGGPALGCVSTLLTVLRLMYGNYSEAPAQQDQQQPEVDPATGQPLQAKRLAPAGDYVTDYRLAVQMWVPREQSKPRYVAVLFRLQ
jgi:hypothetical protein